MILSIYSNIIFFFSSHARTKLMQTNTQAMDYPYPNTNTPSLTIHHALLFCEALCRMCPCDDNRKANQDDCDYKSRQTNLAGNSYEMRQY